MNNSNPHRPYHEYRDTNVMWLGEIPTHWNVAQLKRIVSLKSGEAIDSDLIDSEGAYPVFGGNGIRGYTNLGYTHEGHFALIGRQGALCGNVNYASGRFWASEHAVVVSPYSDFPTTWLGELLRAMNLNQYSMSAAQPGLAIERIGNLHVPIPTDAEQRAIADFLDRETARIDALIARKRRLIELLQEKRTALISHAVTKGLDAGVAMKESGVPWLGEVPAHWEVRKLKFIGTALIGLTYSPADVVGEGEGTLVLRASNIQSSRIVFGDNVFVSAAIPDRLRTRVDDILICARSGSRSLIGKNALIEQESAGMSFGTFMVVFRSDFNRFC